MIEGATLWELVEARAAATPDALFAVDERDRRLTFGDYRDAALRVGAGLHERGIGAETAVSWMLPTTLEALVLAAALARLAAVQNPILPIYRERETRFITRQTGARLLCVPPPFRGFDYPALAQRLAREDDQLDVLIVDGALPEGDPSALPAPPLRLAADQPVRWILYSSGTTADPKGACHTDASLIASFVGLVRVLELAPDDRHAFVFPLTHVGGIGWLIASLVAGFAHVAVAIFEPKRVIPLLARHGVTQAGAGTVFHQAYLAAQREQPGVPLFPRVRAFPGGGAPKPPQLHYDVKRELGGVGIVSGYGLTECPIIAMNSVRDPDAKLAHTEGRANPPEAEIRVVRSDGGLAAAGEEGELCFRGPQLFRGYLDARLDAAAFDADGFFRTGDLGRLDADGYVTITGRTKDVIIRKGENISAKEVEDVLYTHPKVVDVAVIGLPDPALGERCCAVVACRDGELAFGDMVAFLTSAGLAKQKIPEQLEIVPEVPRNAAGKIQKQLLRDRFA
ncbi:MAG TPA: AMP-binding protein [Myxococcota bacterium]|nr:AMP-binding protein [Myxococcota bacterium]